MRYLPIVALLVLSGCSLTRAVCKVEDVSRDAYTKQSRVERDISVARLPDPITLPELQRVLNDHDQKVDEREKKIRGRR